MSLTAAILILLPAVLVLYFTFRKPPAESGSESDLGSWSDDDWQVYDPVRASVDRVYAQAWGTRNALDD